MNKTVKEAYESIEEDYLKISKEYLQLNESDIESALIRHSATFAFFASVLTYAKRKTDLMSIQLETAEAVCMEAKRKELTEAGAKTTQGALNSYILTVPDLVDMRELQVKAVTRYNLAKNIVSSLDHQKDMLVQLSANKRAEIKLHEL